MKIRIKKLMIFAVLAALLLGIRIQAYASEIEVSNSQENIASGVIDEEYGQITWVIDLNGKLTVTGTGDVRLPGTWDSAPWESYQDSISTAEINVTGMTDARALFSSCYYDELDLSGFDTSSITNMSEMFAGCRVKELDLSGFDTRNVTNMNSMFAMCTVQELDLSSFDTRNVTDMDSMFLWCPNLKKIDLSNFDMHRVEVADGMFQGVRALETIDVPINCFERVFISDTDGYVWYMPDGTVTDILPMGLSESVTITRKNEGIQYESPSIKVTKENGIVDAIEFTNNATYELYMHLRAVSEEDSSVFYIFSYNTYRVKETRVYPLSDFEGEFSDLKKGRYKLEVSTSENDSEWVRLEDFSIVVLEEDYSGDNIEMFSEYNSSRKTFFIPTSNLPDSAESWYASVNPSMEGNSILQLTDDGSQFYCYAHGENAQIMALKNVNVEKNESEFIVNKLEILSEKIKVSERDFSEKNIAILDYDHYMSFVASGGTITFDSVNGELVSNTEGFENQNNKWTLENFVKYISGREVYQFVKNLGEKIFRTANLYWTSEVGAFSAKGLYDMEGNEISEDSISKHDIVLVKYEPEIVWVDWMELTGPVEMNKNSTGKVTAIVDAGQTKYPFKEEPQIRFASSNPSVVAVDSVTGELTSGDENGIAVITAYADEDLKAQNGLTDIVTASMEVMVTNSESDFEDPEKMPLAVVKQPEDQIVVEGKKAVFTVEAEGEDLSYQWQYSNNGGKYWYDSGMSGNDTDTLYVDALAKRNGQLYRCVIMDVDGEKIITEAAVLTVEDAKLLAIIQQPTGQTVTEGEKANFTVEVEGEGLSYQWQYSNNDGKYWYDSGMNGNDTDTLNVDVVSKRNGQQYRCVIKDAFGYKVVSEVAVLTVAERESTLIIISQPTSQSSTVGENAVFCVEAEGEGLNYQWQYSNNSGKYWYDSGMSGNNTDTLNVEALAKRNGQQYRCVITDANGNKIVSNEVVLNIK